jgi:hypothetical protein
MSRETLSPATVAALARLLGIPVTDSNVAERIAVGAGAAIAAVCEQLALESDAQSAGPSGNPLFDCEPGDYLATLERLAGDAAAGREPA